MTDTELLEAVAELTRVRGEYFARMAQLRPLAGPEFKATAPALQAWAVEVNARLNETAMAVLGEPLAINAESLGMLLDWPEMGPSESEA